MAQLVQMRQRIKAIETIKKITHAMRLISMSTHTRLRSKEAPVKYYQQQLYSLFLHLYEQDRDWQHPLMHAHENSTEPALIILVGSQKGLCGNFNLNLFSFFNKVSLKEATAPYIIAIGKKAADFSTHLENPILKTYAHFNSHNLASISQDVITIIQENREAFSRVLIVSNILKTFFIQLPYVTSLVPFDTKDPELQAPAHSVDIEYQWEQQPQEILGTMIAQVLYARVYYLLFQSLIAEQAARFLSMDNSTRNANSLLETAQLQYNKLRQTKITQELTELTGSF